MKKSISFLSIFLIILVASTSVLAQNGDKVYGYGYAYSINKKVLYISNIVDGIQNSDTYFDAETIDLGNQWHAHFKASVDKYYNYTIGETGFVGSGYSDYDDIDEERTEMIGDYRQKGYQIKHLNNFNYRNEKYDN